LPMHPLFKREALERMSLGHPAYPRPKGTGDHSMPGKREKIDVSKIGRPARPGRYGQG
jgi:hypothetical protein